MTRLRELLAIAFLVVVLPCCTACEPAPGAGSQAVPMSALEDAQRTNTVVG